MRLEDSRPAICKASCTCSIVSKLSRMGANFGGPSSTFFFSSATFFSLLVVLPMLREIEYFGRLMGSVLNFSILLEGILYLYLIFPSVEACSTPLDCQLNGRCQGGVCLCDPGWTGSSCSQLKEGLSWVLWPQEEAQPEVGRFLNFI